MGGLGERRWIGRSATAWTDINDVENTVALDISPHVYGQTLYGAERLGAERRGSCRCDRIVPLIAKYPAAVM